VRLTAAAQAGKTILAAPRADCAKTKFFLRKMLQKLCFCCLFVINYNKKIALKSFCAVCAKETQRNKKLS